LEKVGQIKGFVYVERAFACISLRIGGNFGGGVQSGLNPV
jgi:hypothetical protein